MKYKVVVEYKDVLDVIVDAQNDKEAEKLAIMEANLAIGDRPTTIEPTIIDFWEV